MWLVVIVPLLVQKKKKEKKCISNKEMKTTKGQKILCVVNGRKHRRWGCEILANGYQENLGMCSLRT